MAQNSNTQKFVNVTEVSSEPIHVPIVVGNEYFIVTQVDVRRIEDTRHINFNKILETGELLPLHHLDETFQQNLLNTFRLVQKVLPSASFTNANLNEFIRKLLQKEIMVQQQLQHQQQMLQALSPNFSQEQILMQPVLHHTAVQPMDVDRNIANIQQQLHWSNRYDNKQVFPLHHSKGTSTTEMCMPTRRRSKSASVYRSSSYTPESILIASGRSVRTHATNTIESGIARDNVMRPTKTSIPISMSTQTTSTSATQTIVSSVKQKAREITTQTHNPAYHNFSAQTPNVTSTQQQTSTHNMSDARVLIVPPQPQRQAAPITAATPMAIPMTSTSKSKELPLGIPVSVVRPNT